jgi:hypothetical protein
MPIVLKSESLNLQESSGLVQGCTGIALPLPNWALPPGDNPITVNKYYYYYYSLI